MPKLNYSEDWVRVRGECAGEEKWVIPTKELVECALGSTTVWSPEHGVEEKVYVRWPVGDCKCGVTCVSWFNHSDRAWAFMREKMCDCNM